MSNVVRLALLGLLLVNPGMAASSLASGVRLETGELDPGTLGLDVFLSSDGEGRDVRLQKLIWVVLPPGTTRITEASITWTNCQTLSWTRHSSASSLVSLADGSRLETIPPSVAVSRERPTAGPLSREGDVVLVPLLVSPGAADEAKGVATWCSQGILEIGGVDWSSQGRVEDAWMAGDGLAAQVANPEDLGRWYRPAKREDPPQDYLVLTRQEFVENSKQLAPFLEFKRSRGFNPVVVTLEDIDLELDQPDLSIPERVRLWLQQHYKERGFRYLLIIGDADPESDSGIPMLKCYPSKGYEDGPGDAPTDMFYADLTGNWDADGDGLYGELNDYKKVLPNNALVPVEDGVDLVPELVVGRISHAGTYSTYGDDVLERTMRHAAMEPEPRHHRALLAMPMITFPTGDYVDGSEVARYLVQSSFEPSAVGYHLMTETEGALTGVWPGETPLSYENLVTSWANGYALVFWCSHGSEIGAYRDVWHNDANGDGFPQQMEVEEPAFIDKFFHLSPGVDDSFPPIVFHASCLNADPSMRTNLANSLNRYLSVVNVASTRVTMGLSAGDDRWEPSPFSPGAFTLGIYFSHGVMVRRRAAGLAFQDALASLTFGVEPTTFKLRLEFNFFGDPTVTLPGCILDAHCDDRNVCNGVESCDAQGNCRPGQALTCAEEAARIAGDPCSKATCDPLSGCLVTPLPELSPCDDAIPCTVSDLCLQGQCVGEPRVCPVPENSCYSSFCVESTGGCQVVPKAEGEACLREGLEGVCVNKVCTFDTPATPDSISEILTPESDAIDEDNDAESPDKPTTANNGCTNAAMPGSRTLPLAMLAVLAALLAALRRRCSRV